MTPPTAAKASAPCGRLLRLPARPAPRGPRAQSSGLGARRGSGTAAGRAVCAAGRGPGPPSGPAWAAGLRKGAAPGPLAAWTAGRAAAVTARRAPEEGTPGGWRPACAPTAARVTARSGPRRPSRPASRVTERPAPAEHGGDPRRGHAPRGSQGPRPSSRGGRSELGVPRQHRGGPSPCVHFPQLPASALPT